MVLMEKYRCNIYMELQTLELPKVSENLKYITPCSEICMYSLKRCIVSYRQVSFADYGTLIALVSESDGCHSGILQQFFLQPVEISNPWSRLGIFEDLGRENLGLYYNIYIIILLISISKCGTSGRKTFIPSITDR